MYKKKHAQKRHKQVNDCFKLDSILFKKTFDQFTLKFSLCNFRRM